MRKINRGPKVKTTSIPAPVGGLNARDSIAAMSPEDALILDNCFCKPSSVDVRDGSVNWGTGLPAWVESVMAYNGISSKKLFAASGSGIYDVTTQAAVGAAAVSGLTSARFQHVNFANAATNWLYAVNGADKPQLYNGTAWVAIDSGSTPAITGVTTTNLIGINVYKSRIWFTEKSTTKIWYLPVNSVGGAAQSIDFGPLFKLGGYLMGMATWTLSNANGTQEFAVFVSSEGEGLIYAGYDPSSAATWYLAGSFRGGRPIGRRFYCQIGSDLALITADGIGLVSEELLTNRSNLSTELSDKILNLVNSDVKSYNANFGWQPILYPIGNKLIINVPQTENSRQYQYVMNTISRSWSTFGKTFSPWNAACFEVFSDSLYYGGNTVVVKCDEGMDDNGAAIFTDIQQAYNYFKSPGQQKYFTMARPIFITSGNVNISIGLNIDFSNEVPVSVPDVTTITSPLWDLSPWDVTAWAEDGATVNDWQTLGGIGNAASFRMRTSTLGASLSWQSTDYVYQYGGIL